MVFPSHIVDGSPNDYEWTSEEPVARKPTMILRCLSVNDLFHWMELAYLSQSGEWRLGRVEGWTQEPRTGKRHLLLWVYDKPTCELTRVRFTRNRPFMVRS